MNESPHTPVSEASGSAGASTWVEPSCPHANPPIGKAPRTHSITVHRPASPSVPSTGCPGRHTAGARAPNRAM